MRHTAYAATASGVAEPFKTSRVNFYNRILQLHTKKLASVGPRAGGFSAQIFRDLLKHESPGVYEKLVEKFGKKSVTLSRL